jgi:WD40 repeat protein
LAAYLATQQSQLATSRALGARSEAVLPTNPELAMLLAREAVRFKADEQAEFALRQAFVRNPRRMIHHGLPGRSVVAKFVGSDVVVAAEPGKRPVVWNVASGRRMTELPSAVGDQVMMSASADQSLVALQGDETSFALYDGKTWKPTATLPGSGARFSRDGAVLTATEENRVRQWSVPSLRERKVAVSLPEGYSVRDISMDGSLLLLAEDGEVSAGSIVEVESGRTVARLPRRVLRPGAGFSPNGRLVITERMDDTGFELWDVQTGRMVRALDRPEPDDIGWTTYVAFSPDGTMFVAGNRNGVLHV